MAGPHEGRGFSIRIEMARMFLETRYRANAFWGGTRCIFYSVPVCLQPGFSGCIDDIFYGGVCETVSQRGGELVDGRVEGREDALVAMP